MACSFGLAGEKTTLNTYDRGLLLNELYGLTAVAPMEKLDVPGFMTANVLNAMLGFLDPDRAILTAELLFIMIFLNIGSGAQSKPAMPFAFRRLMKHAVLREPLNCIEVAPRFAAAGAKLMPMMYAFEGGRAEVEYALSAMSNRFVLVFMSAILFATKASELALAPATATVAGFVAILILMMLKLTEDGAVRKLGAGVGEPSEAVQSEPGVSFFNEVVELSDELMIIRSRSIVRIMVVELRRRY